MGAERFESYSGHVDPETAFTDCVNEAAWINGHGGYTGTIAEKTSFVTRSEPLLMKEAQYFIERDLLNDHDKWGPTWHLPIKDESGNT